MQSSTATTTAFSSRQRLALMLLPPLTAFLLRAVGRTWRVRTVAEDHAVPADQTSRGDLYPFWHRSLLLAAYQYRDLDIRILISASFDGELIARTVARLGFVPVRGSSSRGGAGGLLAISRALAAGHKCAITADGPRGPAQLAKAGAASIAANAARRTGVAQRVSPFYLHAQRAWTLHSWDRFVVPWPFSRVTAAWVSPLEIASDAPGNAAALQAALERTVVVATAQEGR